MAETILQGPFSPSFESLRQFTCPAWFRDAKFGIWSHWGPQSVPMYGDWYARNMYAEGSDQYLYHIRHYGHPSQVGYKDIVKQWKAENFDPEGLMDLFHQAGAHYFVAQAMHHDHFFNYPSQYNHWNSVEVGPHKDIVGLWKKAADRYQLPFGLTEHMGATFSWWRTNKGCDKTGPYAGVPYDGNDPAYRDFYLDNQEHYGPDKDIMDLEPWMTANVAWRKRWQSVMHELIDLYQPELLYSDSNLPFSNQPYKTDTDDYSYGLDVVSHLYNTSAAKHGGTNQAVYNQKDRNQAIYSVGILDIECSQASAIRPEPWQTDTSLGGWFYDVRLKYKQPGHVAEMLVDIVSKNGNLLLNMPQRPDGTLDEECLYALKELAAWNKVCSEGIYGTRPFRIFGEGDSRVVINGFEEKRVAWTSSDFRFTCRDNVLYAFIMHRPEDGRAVIKSLLPTETVKSVSLLGYGPVSYEQPYGTLVAKLPEQLPTPYVNCLKLEFERNIQPEEAR